MSDTNPNTGPNPGPNPGPTPDIEAIFHHARTLPAAERGAYVAAACAGHPAVRAAIEQLLAAVENAGGFLASQGPARGEGAEGAAASSASASASAAPTAGFTTAPGRITERPGVVIGPYKLLQLIGEGGFGTVFLAEQTAPVRRRVALKIIKLGMDTRQVVARFEAERQALAMMDHPHIARVLDGGATDSGRPYFVMEYVVGDAITTFADAHALNIAQRLDLFGQVCSAVQHAHTKGIIHRDLKPGNVLVSMVDDKPFAKVIDFGIAKATGGGAGHLTDKTLFTEHRQLIGTPEYMSPEQAEGSPDIDTRTDVYALGVLLYELLTGSTPIDSERLRRAAWDEMRRMIREEEPPAPSMKLSRSLERLAGTAAARKVEPGRLSAMVKGELDWIVMKALEKERARRYETASALADDVTRHLAGEPVVAAPVSRAYRVRKFVRRNKGAVGAVSAVILALAAGGSVAAWQWREAQQFQLRAVLSESAAALGRDWAAWHSYSGSVRTARDMVLSHQFREAAQVLRKCDPSRSGWEATFLSRIADSCKLTLPGDWNRVEFDGIRLFGTRANRESGGEYSAASEPLPERIPVVIRHANDDWRALKSVASTSTIVRMLPAAWRSRQSWIRQNEETSGLLYVDRGRDTFSVFDVAKNTIVADLTPWVCMNFSASVDKSSSLAIVKVSHDLDGRDSPAALLIDLKAASGVMVAVRPTDAVLRVSILTGALPLGSPKLSITTPDGSRRIVGGADKTVRFYEAKDGKPTLPATAEQPEGVYREVAVFRMPEAVTNLQMTGDGTRLIIHLEGGSARVWDIRDPEERRKDLYAEWAERVPAGAYLDTLWASDTPDDKLRDAVINDASLTPLRRLVAAEMLEERREDDRLAAEEAFEKMKQAAVPASVTTSASPAPDPASITSAVRAAAAAADLPPRVKARVITLAAGWEYKRPEPSDAERLAEETKRRRLAEAQAAVLRIRSTVDEFVTSPDHLRDLREAATQIESSVGANDRRSAEAWLEFALWANDPTDAKDAAMRVVGVYSPPTADLLQAKAWCALAEVEAKSGNIVESAAWLRRFASFIADLPLTATTDGNEWFWWSSAGTVRLARLGPRLVYEARLGAGADMRTSLARAAKRLLASDVEAFVAVASVSDVMSHRVPLDGALQGVFRWHQHRAAVGESDSPSALGILAIVRWTIGAKATDATLAAAAEIDGKPNSLTGGKVLDRDGHRAAAREALAKARALMAPAADGTPSPWANDQDAKSLLAEAAALIEGQPGEPATPAKDDK